MKIIDNLKSIFQQSNFNNVRIEKIKPFQVEYEIKTDTVWFENHNIEECINATQKLGIEHIHLQTNTIDFLIDPRLKNIKGITIQFEIQNINPLFNFNHLTHLGLPENVKIEFDFSRFENLIYLGGSFPKKYINFHQLKHLKFTYLFEYKKSDLIDFAACKDLRALWMYSAPIESLNGLGELSNLTQIDLENCRKLTSLNGISSRNINLHTVHLVNCTNLRKVDALTELPNLRKLQLYQIYELDSLSFLTSLSKLEKLMMHPSKVGVQNNDYYPLIEVLKKLNKLENLKGWKPLNDYLENKIIIEPTAKENKSKLELIKKNLDIMSWVEKSEDGLEQYTRKNCKKAETIILELIKQLENLVQGNLSKKKELIKNCVLELNKLNDSLDGCFIETGEREELCNLFDNIADAVGINIQDYRDGIASEWRDW